jgi:hypothetical protein
MLEFDAALHRRIRRRDRVDEVADGGRGVEELEDPLARGHRRLHDRVLGRQVAQRHEEALHVVDEDVEDAGLGEPRADADDDRHRDARRDLDRREEQRVVADRLVPGVAVVGVHPVELGEIALLAAEELDDLHAGHGLLDLGIDPGDLDPHRAIGLAHLPAEDERRERHHGDDRERVERELRRHEEEHRREAQHLDHVRDQRDEALGEHLGEVLDVVGRARHEAPDRHRVEEAHRELLNVGEDGAPQVEHRVLAGRRHHDLVDPGQEPERDRHAEIEAREPDGDRDARRRHREPVLEGRQRLGRPAARDRVARQSGDHDRSRPARDGLLRGLRRGHDCRQDEVHADLHDPGRGELEHEDRHEEQECDPDLPAIGTHEGPEAQQEPAVVGAAEVVLFLEVVRTFVGHLLGGLAHAPSPTTAASASRARRCSRSARDSSAACSVASRA